MRNKPAVFFVSDLDVMYNNKFNPYPFEAFKDIKRALETTNELTGESHDSCLIQRIDVNSQLFWTDEDLKMLKKGCPLSKLSVGGNKMMEFCLKKQQKGGRCSNYQIEMKGNSLLTIPHSIIQSYEHRTVRSPNRKDKSYKYTLTFMTLKTVETNTRPVVNVNLGNTTSNNTPNISTPTTDCHVDNSRITIGNNFLPQDSVIPTVNEDLNSGRILDFAHRDTDQEKLDVANPNCPFIHLKDTPFTNFSYEDINKTTYFTINYPNRKATYYGDVPYNYTGGSHPPKDINENHTLVAMKSMMAQHFPQYTVNSATVQHYENGYSYIPYHSDNEKEIVDDSVILTMSFGESRAMQFKSISSDDNTREEETTVMNGDVVLMTRASQNLFKHRIKVDEACKGPRISVTWRLMKIHKLPINKQNTSKEHFIHDSRLSSNHRQDSNVYEPRTKENDTNTSHGHLANPSSNINQLSSSSTLLLGDSILSRMTINDGNTLNKCIRGANLDKVLHTINSPEFKSSVQSHHMDHIFICVGTNDLSSGSNITTVLLTYRRLLLALRSLFPDAQIHVMNIFPRKDVNGLGEKVCRVNNGVYHMCKSLLKIKFIKFFFSFIQNSGLKSELYHTDLLHLSSLGLEMVKKCIIECKSEIIPRE